MLMCAHVGTFHKENFARKVLDLSRGVLGVEHALPFGISKDAGQKRLNVRHRRAGQVVLLNDFLQGVLPIYGSEIA